MHGERWSVLLALAVVEMLAMSLWFAGAAVVPQLRTEWALGTSEAGWLTLSVQLGFVVGTLCSALLNLPDRWPVHGLVAACCLLAALSTAGLTVLEGWHGGALGLRFATGVFLAGVYPPGMKIVASWFSHGRGLGVGILIAALTLGKSLPYLLNAGDVELPPWRDVLLFASALSALAAALTVLLVRPGPGLAAAAAFHWRHALAGLRNPATRLANFGYFGHMWELYAMWAWMPALLLASFGAAGFSPGLALQVAFVAIAIGAPGCVLAGVLADRVGRTVVTMASLVVSGTCALLVGFVYPYPMLLGLLCAVWGFAVVADSAQFSTAVTELADKRYVGTALTIQTCIGFLLTLPAIALVAAVAERAGWQWAFLVLVPGPLFGIIAMARLRARPEAGRLAHGLR